MRNLPMLVVSGLLAAGAAPGCAMERDAVVGATRTAGRATVTAAEAGVKVVSWPVRKLWELEPRQVGTATAGTPARPKKPASPDTPEFSGDKVIVAGGVAPQADPDDAPRTAARRSSPKARSTRDAGTRMADRDRDRDTDTDAIDDPPASDRRVARNERTRDADADPAASWQTARGKTRAVAADLDTDPIVIR